MFTLPSLNFFSSKKLPIMGIDITNSAVKLLEIKPYGNQLEVASYGVAPLEKGAIVDRRIKDYPAVIRSIKAVINSTQPTTQRTAVAVPAAAVMTRTLSLPQALDDEAMEALVMLEAEQHIPYPLNEVAIDFQRLPANNPNDDNQPVLLVACRKEVTEQLDNVLEAAGLEPKVTDVENFAMERSLSLIINQLPINKNHYKNASATAQPSLQTSLIAVADIGATTNVFNVLCNGKIIYSREQTFGGKQLTDAIKRHYQLPYATAELAKQQGRLPAEYTLDLLAPFKANLIQQLERQLQLFYSATAYTQIDHLILAGGCSVIENLPQEVQEQLGYATYLANPFAGMVLSDKINTAALAKDAPALMIACGLAIRGLARGACHDD